MVEAGHSPEPYVECGSQEGAIALIHSMMKSRRSSTALFAADNITMLYVLQAFRIAGIQAPGQIAIAGSDDFEMADMLQPSLTVIRQPVYQLGEAAANLLFQRIVCGEAPNVGRRVVLPLELVIRSSCGCKPGKAKSAREQKSTSRMRVDEAGIIPVAK
jgi:LacI family transcriptional regulator